MDDKRELNDILIGGEDSRARQTKKLILLIVAIVILVLAIAIIALSMTGSNEEETIIIGTENANPALPNSSFDNVPVNNTEEDQFEKIVQEIKARQQNNATEAASVPAAPAIPPEAPKATMPNKSAQQAPKAVVSSQPRVASATTSNRQTASSAFRGNNGDIAESGYYLQVGAFSKTPNKAFLDNLNKYSYRIQEIMINSKVITRYLVGPYSSRDEAQRDYNNVARDITTPVFLEVQ